MSGLCHRRLRNYEEARENFSIISEEIERKHKDVIKKQIFGALLVPFTSNRQTMFSFLVTMKGMVEFYSEKKKRELLSPPHIKQSGLT